MMVISKTNQKINWVALDLYESRCLIQLLVIDFAEEHKSTISTASRILREPKSIVYRASHCQPIRSTKFIEKLFGEYDVSCCISDTKMLKPLHMDRLTTGQYPFDPMAQLSDLLRVVMINNSLTINDVAEKAMVSRDAVKDLLHRDHLLRPNTMAAIFDSVGLKPRLFISFKNQKKIEKMIGLIENGYAILKTDSNSTR